MPYFYTKQKTIIGDNGGPSPFYNEPDDPPYFDNEVNEFLYSIKGYLDIRITYDTVLNPINNNNNRPIHIAYITWKEEVLGVDDKIKTKK